MHKLISIALMSAGFAAACIPAYMDTAAPKTAKFEVACASRCGPGGRQPGTLITMSFAGGARSFALCCDQHQAFLQQLQTIRTSWCEGVEVPERTFGSLKVGTVVSEITGKRGATLDHGEGFVAFNCNEWLDELIAKTQGAPCCAPRPSPAPAPVVPAAAPVPVVPAPAAPVPVMPAPAPPASAVPVPTAPVAPVPEPAPMPEPG